MIETAAILKATGPERFRLIVELGRGGISEAPRLVALWSISDLSISLPAMDVFSALASTLRSPDELFPHLESAAISNDARRRGFAALASLYIAVRVRPGAVPEARHEVIEALHSDDLDVAFLAARSLWPALETPLAPFEGDSKLSGTSLRRLIKILLRSAGETRVALESAPPFDLTMLEPRFRTLEMRAESLELLVRLRGLEDDFLEQDPALQIRDHEAWWDNRKGRLDAQLVKEILKR